MRLEIQDGEPRCPPLKNYDVISRHMTPSTQFCGRQRKPFLAYNSPTKFYFHRFNAVEFLKEGWGGGGCRVCRLNGGKFGQCWSPLALVRLYLIRYLHFSPDCLRCVLAALVSLAL